MISRDGAFGIDKTDYEVVVTERLRGNNKRFNASVSWFIILYN